MILQHVCSQRCVPSREYHNIKGQLIQEMSRLDTFYKLQPSKTEPPKSIVSVERSAPVDDTFDLRSSRYRVPLILLSTQPTKRKAPRPLKKYNIRDMHISNNYYDRPPSTPPSSSLFTPPASTPLPVSNSSTASRRHTKKPQGPLTPRTGLPHKTSKYPISANSTAGKYSTSALFHPATLS